MFVKNQLTHVVSLLCAGLLAGCGSLPENKTGNFNQIPVSAKVVAHSTKIKHELYKQFHEWRDVRYRLGGLSKKGIDCSGFVYLTYKQRLGIDLPRTARLQAELGREIGKNELKTGDLVFFKTGKITQHVGIFLERNKFLHVSASKGVIISTLDNVYWKAQYWKSIRL